jgi:hypothetical protein
LGGPLSKLCVTPPFSINFRCQIENQVSDYRLLGTSSLNEEINKYIDKNEILNCIKKLKCNKASGEDYITNEYIKATATQFINIYEKLFNVIFV